MAAQHEIELENGIASGEFQPVTEPSKSYALNLDDMCVMAACLANSLETISENRALIHASREVAERTGTLDEWEKINADFRVASEKLATAAEHFIAIHDAMHNGENVQVMVVPF